MENIIKNEYNDSETTNSDNESQLGMPKKFNNEFIECNVNNKNRTRNRPSKAERYEKEREELIKELEKKMGLTEEIRVVLLYDLEHNEKLKEYLKKNISEIKKLYKYGCWNYFIQKEEKRDIIGLLKSIFKSEKYELMSKMKYAEREGKRKKYSHIYFLKDLNLNQYFK